MLGQVIDRGHAATLLVWDVGQGPNLALSIHDSCESVKIAVTKMELGR